MPIRPALACLLLAACGAPATPAAPAAPAAPADPVLFAPGVVTSAPAFTPDGNTVYFTRTRTIVVVQRRGDGWTEPVPAPFSGQWGDSDPSMAPDGSFLVFVSNRPAAEPGPPLDGEWGFPERTDHPGQGGNLWRVDRQGDGWGKPWRLPEIINRASSMFEPSVVADGSLYFMDAHLPGRFRTYRSQLVRGVYQVPEQVPFTDGTHADWDATVAPDESFMVLASDRPPASTEHGDDLFIAYRRHGAWTQPVHLGPHVNDAATASIKPRLAPDHHTLYFSSDRAAPGEPPAPTGASPVFRIWRVDLAPWIDRA